MRAATAWHLPWTNRLWKEVYREIASCHKLAYRSVTGIKHQQQFGVAEQDG
jgi:hypothetical protein